MNSVTCPKPSVVSAFIASFVPLLSGAGLPLLFIVLWSSGYPAGKLGLAHAGPLTLLSLRFGVAALLLLALALATRAPWPRRWQDWAHLGTVGALMQGLHFVGVYEGIHLGLPAGVAALLIGLMPLATAFGARLLLGETLGRSQLTALLGGLAGVALVVASRPMHGAAMLSYLAALLGLTGLVLGTLYQKRFCAHMDLRSGACVQMGTAALLVGLPAGSIEHFAVQFDVELIGALLWLAVVNAIAAFSLMFVLIRRGQASAVARLFFLIPGVSAFMGYALLGERLSALALVGFALGAIAEAIGARRN